MIESQTAPPTLSIPSSSQIAVQEQPPRITYAKIVQNPSASHFQHDPARAAKKMFQDDEIHTIGSDSNYKGEPGIIYSSMETAQLASRLKFTLVGKFSHGLPNLNFLRNRIIRLGLKGNVSVGRLNLKHVLIRLANEEDFARIWLRGEWTFDSFHMRVFKWTPNFDPKIESAIAPVWIRLPELPVHLFEKNALFTLASKIGKPLRMDEPTADLSRPDLACVCVELDLTAPKVHVVYLNIEGKTYRQQILYENCPPYCSSCNHLGHDIATCIVKLNNEKSQANLEPMLPDKLSNQMEEIRDLREIINNKRKGKNVLIANDSAAALNINQNSDQLHTEKTRKLSSDDIAINANAVEFPTSHVHVPESLITSENNPEGKTVVASPNDLTYEDPLIAELLDKDWDADKTSQNKRLPINIDDVEAINNSSEQQEISRQPQHDHITEVPKPQSKELSPQASESTKKILHGETSRQRNRMEHSQKQPFYEVQTAPLDSEGEDEHTPIFNRFQSLEDLETEDTLQKLESMQNVTLPANANMSERGNETINITHTFEIRSDMDGHNQEGQEVQQKVIFTDSKASNKHKRNKSVEDNTILAKSPKTGDDVYFTRKFAFHSVFSNSNNKIWCFAKFGVDIQIIQDHTQFLHVKVNSRALPEDIFCTFIYAKCYRAPRRILWDELTRISHQNVPWLVGGDFNAILHPNENQGGDMRRIGSMDDFNDMMSDTGLIDAGFEGEPFTWTNNRVWRRLDRVLYSKEWTESFNTTRVLHLPRRLSDHHPLLINAANVEDKKPSSFRFQNMWLKHHTFLDTVKQSWCLPTEG
ncbi:UNVERIFIED_CONTAM: hypothetical protein Sindi_0948000 [Sesamum indicum]